MPPELAKRRLRVLIGSMHRRPRPHSSPSARIALRLRALLTAAITASLSAQSLACAPPKSSTPYPTAEPPAGEVISGSIAHYFARAIDLAPLLDGFPYSHVEASLARDRLFFFETGDGYTLKTIDLRGHSGPVDLDEALAISDVDWSTRSLWGLHLPQQGSTLWLHADARNDERMNLWTLDLRSQQLTQVTDHDYVYGFGFSQDDSLIAYLPREGDRAGNHRSCLRILEVESRASREVICDSPALTFTWSSPRFSPDNREVFFNALVEGDRNRKMLVSVNLNERGEGKGRKGRKGKKGKKGKGALRMITDHSPRSRLEPVRGWIDGQRLLFIANDDGFANLYTYDRTSGAIVQLSHLQEDVRSAAILDAGIFAISGTPAGSTISLLDPESARIVGQQRQDGKLTLIDGEGDRVLWSKQAPDLLFEAELATISKSEKGGAPGLSSELLIALEPALAKAVVHCKAEALTIPTHDIDPATGRARELHAFVLRPQQPMVAKEQQRALIKAFYGGDNRYSVFDQVMCAAGLTVISPAVRGSSGFGKDFAALNDHDLGGAEILDLFEVARWTEQTFDLESWQIGVYGGSHGGYATMRALTFEPVPGRYDFGFGLAHAGFSDILTFYRGTNIPDWVRLEGGDPEVAADAARMRKRSALANVQRLRAPLLLTHGANDARVPVDESRQIANKAAELGRPVTYVEFDGQGHHIEGLRRRTEYFQANFDLLENVNSTHRSTATSPIEP